MASWHVRRWPHGPKTLRYGVTGGTPTGGTPLGPKWGPFELRSIKRYGLAALDAVSGIEVGLTESSVVFNDDFQWIAELQRGRIRLFDDEGRVIAEAFKLDDSADLGRAESVLQLERTKTTGPREKGVYGGIQTVLISGLLTETSGSPLATMRLQHTSDTRRYQKDGPTARTFSGTAEANRSMELPPFLLSLSLTAGRWTSRAPRTGISVL